MDVDEGTSSARGSRIGIIGQFSVIFVALLAFTGTAVSAYIGARSAADTTSATAKASAAQSACDTLRTQRLAAYKNFIDAQEPMMQSFAGMIYLVFQTPSISSTHFRIPDRAVFHNFLVAAEKETLTLQSKWSYASLISEQPVQEAGDKVMKELDLGPWQLLDQLLRDPGLSQIAWDNKVNGEFPDDLLTAPDDNSNRTVWEKSVRNELNRQCE